ncbi:MAG: hypothetical protein IRZ05_00595 [Micromonosporaceae bacterium]|jgi:hypothetical protein|nr:hypothetical protein [Micromonosporaceae bacterium]
MARQTPTDRGYAVIFENEDGVNLGVCTAVSNGRPSDLFAVHTRMSRIDVEDGITFSTVGKLRISDRPVAVLGEDGVVYVRATVPSSGAIASVPS